jgi:hypothetical protein
VCDHRKETQAKKHGTHDKSSRSLIRPHG